MKKTRISIEWNYMTTANIFKYLQQLHKKKLMSGGNVSKIYIVCTILRNMHVALYGCQTSNYFNISFPNDFLEQYMQC